ncbi:MAG: hypothetical protein WD696_19295 [Bryobacteraceae bacterium]
MAALLDASNFIWHEVDAPVFAPEAGFLVAPLQIRVFGEIRPIPWVWKAPGTSTPSLAEYDEFRDLRARVSVRLAAESASRSPEVVRSLEALLKINPSDLQTLKLATDSAARAGDFASAGRNAVRVLELEPLNGPYWSRLGFYNWQSANTENAEGPLLRGRELLADHPQSAAILGEIQSRRSDHLAALPHYEEAVEREPARADLWLKLADTQRSLRRAVDMAHSLEAVLNLQPKLWERRTQVIDHYLGVGNRDAASRHIDLAAPLLPADISLTTRFASYQEQIGKSMDAIALWLRVVELDPAHEAGHYAVSRLYAQSKAWDKALAASEAGISAAPVSARLHALHADALLALDRLDGARRFLWKAAERVPDSAILDRVAGLEDRYGSTSPRYYKSLVEALRASGASEAVWKPLSELGVRVSIRDRQPDACRWFARLIDSNLCDPVAAPEESPGVVVPGGIQALLFMASGPAGSSPEAFLADYGRTLMTNLNVAEEKVSGSYRERLIEYFGLLAELKAKGRHQGEKTVVRLSLEDRNAARLTERILTLLGWRTRRESGKLVVEPATEGRRARRQDLASALGIDVIAMQERLQSGEEFLVEIVDERVSIFPEENVWQRQFYAGKRYPGGFVEAMARHAPMSSLYSALSNMDRGSAASLISSIGMKRLAEEYGTLLALYSSCLQIHSNRIQVPGGEAAMPIWAALAGAKTGDAPRFLRSLLDKDDGRLVRFYFLLSQLDFPRQRFFTVSQTRTFRFYEAFRDSSQIEGKRTRDFASTPIHDLFRELPIDPEGRLLFPGGPKVWMVAKGQTPSSVERTEGRLRRLSRVTTPELEDEILLRLIKIEYMSGGKRLGAWQNFLAVARVEAARSRPVDQTSALLLAENFAANEGLYAYFARMSALEAEHYREIFRLINKLRTLDPVTANTAAGRLHAALHFLGVTEQSGLLKPGQGAELMLGLCKSMNEAETPGQYAEASIDFLHAFLAMLKADPKPDSLRDILLPRLPKADIPAETGHRTLDPGEVFRRRYDSVIQMQKVPSLAALLGIREALAALSLGKDDLRRNLALLLESSNGLRHLGVPKDVRMQPTDRELLESDRPVRIAALQRQFQREIAKKKVNSKRLQKLANEYWDAIAFQTTIALAGQVYAAYLHPDDLLVAEDPFFLRKHWFLSTGRGERDIFPIGTLDVYSGEAGSRAIGGFDGMAAVAGGGAATTVRNLDASATHIASALFGAVRTTDWSRLTPERLRSAALQIRAARDWLILAASHPALYDLIGELSYGLISLNRRTTLLQALLHRQWERVWSSLSHTDLFFLAARLRDRNAAAIAGSPVIWEWESFPAAAPSDVNLLGPALRLLRRNPSVALVELGPYEDSATQLFPAYMAERLAEFKVYLACLLVDQALPAAALPAVAEAAARHVLQDIQMSGYGDWLAVLDAYRAFDAARLNEVIGAL